MVGRDVPFKEDFCSLVPTGILACILLLNWYLLPEYTKRNVRLCHLQKIVDIRCIAFLSQNISTVLSFTA